MRVVSMCVRTCMRALPVLVYVCVYVRVSVCVCVARRRGKEGVLEHPHSRSMLLDGTKAYRK